MHNCNLCNGGKDHDQRVSGETMHRPDDCKRMRCHGNINYTRCVIVSFLASPFSRFLPFSLCRHFTLLSPKRRPSFTFFKICPRRALPASIFQIPFQPQTTLLSKTGIFQIIRLIAFIFNEAIQREGGCKGCNGPSQMLRLLWLLAHREHSRKSLTSG